MSNDNDTKEPLAGVLVGGDTNEEIGNILEDLARSDGDETVRVGQGEGNDHITIPDELNLLPLRDAVVFPMLVAPIAVGRDQFVKLIDDSVVGGNRIIGMVTQRDPATETPGPGDIYPMGVAVAIRMMGKGQDATRLIVQGLQRFQILQVAGTDPYMTARVRLLDDETVPEDSVEIEALKRQLAGLFTRIVDLSQDMPDELKNIAGIEQPSVATDLMAAHVGRLSTADKIEVLQTLNVKERMTKLLGFLTREAQVLELGANLQNQVAGEMGKAQREYYLREQLKAIQKELG